MLQVDKQKLLENISSYEETDEHEKAEALIAIDTRLKVLESLKQCFEKQLGVLCRTNLAFDFDKAVKDVRSTLTTFGATRDHRLV